VRRGHLVVPVTWFTSIEYHIALGPNEAFCALRRHSCGVLFAPVGFYTDCSVIQSVTPAHCLVLMCLEVIVFPNLLAGHRYPKTHYLA